MKKLSIALSLTFLVLCSSFTLNDWKPVTLQQGITVSMPGTVVQEKMQQDMLTHKSELTPGVSLIAMMMDFGQFGLTADLLQQMAGTDEFVEQMEMGIESSGGNIVSTAKGQYKGLPYLEFVLEKEQDGKKHLSLLRMIFYQQWGINLTYKYGTAQQDAAIAEKFFNSLTIPQP